MDKRYQKNAKQVDEGKKYSLEEALGLIKKFEGAKFDESINISIRLGIDSRQTDQQVRGAVGLPHGTGKSVRVAVFAKGEKAEEAKKAGADIVGAEDLAKKVEGGFLDFDKVVASPDMMGTVGKLGRVLGPKGLMPNPKLGTVTADVTKAVTELKAGKVEFRADKGGIVHCVVGRKSFDEGKLVENVRTFIEALVKAKPSSAKGIYLRSITLAPTMGPGVACDAAPFLAM